MPPAKARALQGETDHLQPRDRQNTHSIPNTKSKRVAGPGGTTASSSKTANGANTTGSVSTGQQENAEGDASQAVSRSKRTSNRHDFLGSHDADIVEHQDIMVE